MYDLVTILRVAESFGKMPHRVKSRLISCRPDALKLGGAIIQVIDSRAVIHYITAKSFKSY